MKLEKRLKHQSVWFPPKKPMQNQMKEKVTVRDPTWERSNWRGHKTASQWPIFSYCTSYSGSSAPVGEVITTLEQNRADEDRWQ